MTWLYMDYNSIQQLVVEMKRQSTSSQHTLTLQELLKRGTSTVLTQPNDRAIFCWEPEYLTTLISHLHKLYTQEPLTSDNSLKVELFVAKCCTYHKEALKEAVEFFQEVDFVSGEREVWLQRLRIVTLLMQIEWFPKHVVKVEEREGMSQLERVYLNNIRRSQGEDVTVDEEGMLSEIESLRDYLAEIRKERADVVAHIKNKAVYFHVSDVHIRTKSQLEKQILAEDILIMVTPEEELPSQLDNISDKIEIWVDKSIEFNSLIGNYVCTERYGEFKWVNGPLVYALQKGLWLLLNNFQQASNELIVALKNIINNGYLYSQSLGKVYISPGFKIVGTSNQPLNFENIPLILVEKSDPKTLLPSALPEKSREYFEQVLNENSHLGYPKVRKLWKRIEYMRKQFVESEYDCLVENIWEGYITESFKDIVKEELDEISNRFIPRTVSYTPRSNKVKIGRVTFEAVPQALGHENIVHTQYSLRIMEKISMGVIMKESILLVSETGCGKTTLIQHLAKLRGKKLHVINMNLGSEASDLVGGFKPLDFKFVYQKLITKFRKYFDVIKTEKSLSFENVLAEQCSRPDNHLNVLKMISSSFPTLRRRTGECREQLQKMEVKLNWDKLEARIQKFVNNFDIIKNQLVFSFVEGNLLKALKKGDWILVDEINLAGNQVLQKLVPLVEGKSILMYEKGDLKVINRHPEFRLFGCMNPGNDHGKKHLPKNLAEKFTILELPEPEREDIKFFINSKCGTLNAEKLTNLYFELRKGKVLSLRNLARALNYINTNRSTYAERAVFDGLVLGFGCKDPFTEYQNANAKLPQKPGFVEVFGFLLEKGPFNQLDSTFKITKRFEEHVKDLLRAVAGTELPVLLEGPTSAGKTSMVRYIASLSGHKCIRINNHEHTDVEEYLGTYYPSKTGQLVFREGPLVEAVRNGYWLILDELNLARSEILECLNRLLDDNRELFLPEIQETLKPHPHFRIFATQNPSSYSGRKTLSKAFRNRFIQLQMGEIDTDQTIQILEKRVPLVEQSREIREYLRHVLNNLSQYRLREKVFIKDAVITIRDLLKWTQRLIDHNNLKENFALEGYTIIGERLRTPEEKVFVKGVLQQNKQHFDEKQHYHVFAEQQFSSVESIRLNNSFARMASLTLKALRNKEPVLLIGETGCGKTTLAELLAKKFNRPLYSINCHKHIEASDFLGCLRPNPTATRDQSPFVFVNGVLLNALINGGVLLIDEINTAEDSVLERMNEVLEGGQTIGVERGEGWEIIEAHPEFRIIATMNPSGDFGKKELSPALRNRFTEIWVQPVTHPAYLETYKSLDASENDVLQMILKEMNRKGIREQGIAWNLFNLVYEFNCKIAVKYMLQKRTLTLRDIVWVINFLKKSENLNPDINTRYLWALHILVVEGTEFLPLTPESKSQLRSEISHLIDITHFHPLPILLQLNFPILILTELPFKLIPIPFHKRIFFNVHTELSDILGQYRPEGNVFRWHDGPLLSAVKEGQTVALVDLNLAQQQVVEGINSLFDYRGNIFVVDLDTTFEKHPEFKPVVVLKIKVEGDRKMLPNSFLNRFVKLHLSEFTIDNQMAYLHSQYPSMSTETLVTLSGVLHRLQAKGIAIKLKETELFCSVYEHTKCLRRAIKIPFCYHRSRSQILPLLEEAFCFSSLQYLPTREQQHLINYLPLLHQKFNIKSKATISLILDMLIVYNCSPHSIILKGATSAESKLAVGRCFAWLLNLNLVHILLANNTDSTQLLGTYQQTEVNGEPVFKFVDSRLIESLSPKNMVLIEVCSDRMMERIEKGIEDIYDGKQKVLIACEGNNIETVSVEIDIDTQWVDATKVNSVDLPEVEYLLRKYLEDKTMTPNLTNFSLATRYLSRDSLLKIIIPLFENVSTVANKKQLHLNKPNETAILNNILRSLQFIHQQVEASLDSDYQPMHSQTQRQDSLLESIEQRILSDKNLVLIYNPETEQLNTRLNLSYQMPKSFDEYKLQCSTMYLFELDPNRSDSLLRLFNYDEQVRLKEVARMFQRLYIVNGDNFKNTAESMLPIVMRSQTLLEKFMEELTRMPEGTSIGHLIVIEEAIDSQVIKRIPILNTSKNIRHYLTDLAQEEEPVFPVREIFNIVNQEANILPNYTSALPGFESQLLSSVASLIQQQQFSLIGSSIANVSIKHTKLLDLFNSWFFRVAGQNTQIGSTVQEIFVRLGVETGQMSSTDKGITLLKMFKPKANLNENISFYARNYQKYQTLSEFIQFERTYFETERFISNVRCGEFEPSLLGLLAKELETKGKEMEVLKKSVVYRGADNIDELKYFYQNLMTHYNELEQAGLTRESIRVFVSEMMGFYDRFKDILLPLLTALMLLLPEKSSTEGQVLLSQCHRVSMQELIIEFTAQEVPDKMEEDNAKRYLILQKKLHEMVIDEYTKEGEQHHKDQQEEDFLENFRQGLRKDIEDPLDKIYGYFRESKMDAYNISLSKIQNLSSITELSTWMSILLAPRSKEHLDIYSEWSILHSSPLMEELFTILGALKSLLQSFQTQQTKALCLLINAILDLKMFRTQVYKLLEGCEHIVDKIIELNHTLPRNMRIAESGLCDKIILLRKIEMRNWANMVVLKEQRVEKNDLVEFVGLWRVMVQGHLSREEAFVISDRFMREASVGTFKMRMENLECASQNMAEWISVMRVHQFYSYFEEEHSATVTELKTSIEREIKEYKQLAGWKSTNYLILKSTSEKFQRSIHKILKKYEDSLKAPFVTIIQKHREMGFADSLAQYHDKFKSQVEEDPKNQYEELIAGIFQSIDEMKSEAHNNKTRMTIVNQYAAEIRSIFEDLVKAVKLEGSLEQFVPDFSVLTGGSRMKKYYYGVWDRFNQRNEVQGKWEVDTIDKLWRIIETGWRYINHWLYSNHLRMTQLKERNNQYTTVQRVLKPFGWTLENPKPLKGHPLFEKEVLAFNDMIIYNQETSVRRQDIPDEELEEISSLTKLLYVVSNVVLNLQKSGFCVKEEQEQQEGEGEELKGGMGLGEADADKEAENIADEIEFEEQLQGLKGDKEANQDDIDNKEDKKDFEMQNDFNAEAKSMEQKEGEDEQEQSKEDSKIDEGFGDVGNQEDNEVDKGQDSENEDNGENKKEDQLDYKTDKKADKDDEIKAKEDPKDKKDTRNLGEDEFNQASEGEEDSNMKGGEMLDQNQMQEQNQDNLEQESGVEQRENKEGMEIESEEENLLEEKDDQKGDDEIEEKEDTYEHRNEDKDMMEEEMPQEDENPENEGEKEQENEKPKLKPKTKPKKAPAYGVEGDEKNPLLEGLQKENPNEQENNNEGDDTRGKDDKQRSEQNTFSRQFIEEILEAAQQTGNEEFKKNLNVVEQKLQEMDEKDNAGDEEKEEGEEYALSKDSQIKTNVTTKQKTDKVDPIAEENMEQEEEQNNQEPYKPTPKEIKEKIEEKINSAENRQSHQGKREATPKQQVDTKKETEKPLKNQGKSGDLIQDMEVEKDHTSTNQAPLSSKECEDHLSNNKMKVIEEIVGDWGDEVLQQAEKHSLQLYEQLKAVLEPQQVASYQGDYKTGKKLNMRKIIPFIASQYRKDRIWLRRSQPTDRNYQILIGIDDTKSMGINNVGRQALEGSFALAFALAKLNIKTSITRIRERMSVLHSFDELFTEVSCRSITKKFSFGYEDIHSHNLVMPNFMKDSLAEFKRQKDKSSDEETQQLCFIVSDGRFNKNFVRPFLREAEQRGIIYVFVIVDKAESSILNVKEPVAKMNPNGTFHSFDMRKKYMSDFPFEYYLVVKDIKELSSILAEVLSQYFEQGN